jgi:hypothetical protein
VIVYERHDRMKAVIVARNGELQNRFGVFPHNEWIGKPFGCRVVGKKGGGFVFLLAPTPELWTLVLPHRTQILYVADISFVISFLELRPGSVMLESGTGSGSLTHSLARAVAPSGHVHTFDFHEQRALAAKYVPIPLSLSLSLSLTHTHTHTHTHSILFASRLVRITCFFGLKKIALFHLQLLELSCSAIGLATQYLVLCTLLCKPFKVLLFLEISLQSLKHVYFFFFVCRQRDRLFCKWVSKFVCCAQKPFFALHSLSCDP